MINTKIRGDTEWKHVPTRLSPPCFVPPGASQHGVAWEIRGASQDLLTAAVRGGCSLTVAQLAQLNEALTLPMPVRGQGSGTRGGLKKEDYVRALIQYLFGDDPSVDEAARQQMFQGVMGEAFFRKARSVRCPEDVIAAVRHLGQEAESDFHFIHSVALNQQAVEHERQRTRAAAQAEDAYEQRTYTPVQLKSLLPPVAGVWCNRQPLLKRYQAAYPGQCLALQMLDCFFCQFVDLISRFWETCLGYIHTCHILGVMEPRCTYPSPLL